MNRAERRRQNRHDQKKTKTYTMTEEQMAILKNNMTEIVANEFLEAVFGISVLVVHDKFGELMRKTKDGKSREERFFDMCMKLYGSFEDGYLTLEDIRQTLCEECGAEFKYKGKE